MFCQKCGEKLKEGAVFCNSCGQEQGNSVTPNTPMQSIQDFLAISPEYQAKKSECEKKKKNNKRINMTIFAVAMILSFVCFFFSVILGLIFILVWFIFGFIALSKESKYNRQLTEDGEELYRQYVNNR